MKIALPLVTLLILFFAGLMPAQEQKKQLTREEKEKIVDGLQWKTGSIPIDGDKATLTLANNYRFLNPADARKVLTDIWRNPPSNDLGMIFPDGTTPRDMNWAAVVEGFEEAGYVKDDDADKLDADKLLKDMQDAQKEANASAAQQGYSQLEIVGWAMKPKYDKETKKLTWATDLRNIGSDHHSINYYVRILGRHGYLVLNVLGNVESLPEIEKGLPSLLSMVNFNEGHRYADFNPKTDKVAAYGIAGLIAAGVGLKLLKVGFFAAFFKPIMAFLLAAKKLVVVAILGIGAFIKKLFGKKDASTN